jgi:glycosyltransferase involved in cell wall biosynthesis
VLRDAVDVLVTAAREETFGLNIAEAASFGVPALASDIEAHSEIVADGVEGLLFPTNDASALADAMAALAGDPARRARLGAAARERTLRSFLVERYVAEFEATYERLLAAPRSRYGWSRGARWPRVYTARAASSARKQAARVFGLILRPAH